MSEAFDPENPGWAPINPFAGNADYPNQYEFLATSPVDATGLLNDIVSACKIDSTDLMVGTTIGNLDAGPSEGNPLHVFVVSRKPLDKPTVQDLVDGHEPPVSPVATTPTGVTIASDDPSLPGILDKLGKGQTLSTKEISVVLKGIAGV